ncbi:hypothetical protein QFZ36_000490 [Pseudarthrobacter siccitolerans]|uniref:Uncharacterized protein n=1 Tax=Pseudarthrobacter siccitolerans TaxID=861266 RepID=A0ABU0PG35_9MICC|nr:hypothetical protein [Pseudarthrobacter siccitolerans]MDQ0672929.1 hypothetical protein [Pseudarthrobacter siccitolerans]
MASNAIGGGAVDAEGFLKWMLHLYRPGYTRALNVTQRAAGANMSVDVNIDSSSYGGALFVTTAAVPYFGYTNAIINSTVTTADPTNPRKDIVVAYIDLSLITTGTTNNLGAFKIKVVPGTAAASPSDPSGATIQASVGAGNPYIQLARVSLTAALGSITNAVITDLRTPAANAMPYLWGGALNTVGHLVPNQADGTVVTTTDTGSVSTAMLANLGVTNAKLAANAAWTSYTPTLTNITLGNGTLTGKYQQIGKTVNFRVSLILGSTSAISGDLIFSLPVTSAAYAGTSVAQPLGHATLLDAGIRAYQGEVEWASTTTCAIKVLAADVTYLYTTTASAAIPFAWATGDEIEFSGTFEAA